MQFRCIFWRSFTRGREEGKNAATIEQISRLHNGVRRLGETKKKGEKLPHTIILGTTKTFSLACVEKKFRTREKKTTKRGKSTQLTRFYNVFVLKFWSFYKSKPEAWNEKRAF